MTWTYVQRTGSLLRNGHLVGSGYAGRYEGKNNPAMQDVKETGPLPVGWYDMKEERDHPDLGPAAIQLVPRVENQMFGRNDFWMHGERKPPAPTGFASKGCIIQSRPVRDHVDSLIRLGESALQVVAETPGEETK